MPEISANNKVFGGSKARAAGRTATSNDMNICSAITPSHEDIIVIKRRVSAFTGSDLDLLLRSIGVKNIILTGVATGGVVLSTLCEAADKDYSVTVLSDACADYNEEVHHFLIEKVFPFQSTVKTLTEFEAND
jgi:nicotinamidase-related amidase